MRASLIILMLVMVNPMTIACPRESWSPQRIQTLRQAEFALPSDDERDQLAQALVPCLAHPDPALRDGFAYEALASWLRADALSIDRRRQIMVALLAMLDAEDPDGFAHPFAALTLSEVARTDRISPWLKRSERKRLTHAASEFLRGIRDYRGFHDAEGWRHGVAHGADWVMQLVLNPKLDRPAVEGLLAAVLFQVAPQGAPAYHFGEPDRLARPLVQSLLRGTHGPADLVHWLHALTDPAPWADWSRAFASEQGLARRHNIRAFLMALLLAIELDPPPEFEPLRQAILEAAAKVG